MKRSNTSLAAASAVVLGVTLALVCAAPPVRAADTGLLYVKSDPSGATVLVDGNDCGKTPVLIRDLEPGERFVVVKLQGALPKSDRVTIQAGKVAKYVVQLELLLASLTLISEPLEATVIMDLVNRGITPLTIENLTAGQHRLTVDKTGYEAHHSTVSLAAGENKVHELKLAREGAAEAAAHQVAAQEGALKKNLEEALEEFEKRIARRDYECARKLMQVKADEPANAEIVGHLRAAAQVARALKRRQQTIREALEKQIGKEVELETKAGKRTGKLLDVTPFRIAMATEIKIGGQAMGQTAFDLKWQDLSLAQEETLARDWDGGSATAACGRALLASAAGADNAVVSEALARAGNHPVASFLRSRLRRSAKDEGKKAAEVAWRRIEEASKAPTLSRTAASSLSRALDAFERKHGDSMIARTHEPDRAQLRKRLLKATSPVPYQNLVLWLAADVGTELVDNRVSRWLDNSDAEAHASQPNPSRRPAFVKNAIQGRPALRFDGVDDSLAISDAPSGGEFSVTFVAQTSKEHSVEKEHGGGIQGQCPLNMPIGAMHGGSASAGLGVSLGTNGISVYLHGNCFLPAVTVYEGTVGSRPVVVTVIFKSNIARVYLNGRKVREGVRTSRLNVSLSKDIGGNIGPRKVGRAFAGDIAEIIYYKIPLPNATRWVVERHLMRKYLIR